MKILPENAEPKLVAQLLSDFVTAKEQIQMPKKTNTAGGGKSFSYKYAGLDTVFDAINKGIKGTGISYMQENIQRDNNLGVKNYVIDKCGAYIEYEPIVMPMGSDRQKNAAQSAGSLLTYLRRYSISAIFGLAAEEDDDGRSYGGYSEQSHHSVPRQQYQRQAPQSLQKRQPTTIEQARAITMTYQGKPTNLSTVFSHAMLKNKEAGEFLKQEMAKQPEVKAGVSLLTQEFKAKQAATKQALAKQEEQQPLPEPNEAPKEQGDPLDAF